VPEGVSEYVMLAQLQTELVAVQSSLFCLGLELEASQRSLRRSQRQGDDLSRFKDRLDSDLQEVQQYREVTEKHNQVSVFVDMCVKQILVSVGCSMCDLPSVPQDLLSALQKTRSELQAREAALKDAEVERHTVVQEKDRSIAQLKHSLQDKERQLQVINQFIQSVVACTHFFFFPG